MPNEQQRDSTSTVFVVMRCIIVEVDYDTCELEFPVHVYSDEKSAIMHAGLANIALKHACIPTYAKVNKVLKNLLTEYENIVLAELQNIHGDSVSVESVGVDLKSLDPKITESELDARDERRPMCYYVTKVPFANELSVATILTIR